MPRLHLKKYAFIDALRGIAILGVVLVHSSQSVSPSQETLAWFMGEGARGVQLFFVASAITLYMSWVARRSGETAPVRNFYIRRFFRIAPMFYLAILAYVLVDGGSPSYWAPNGIAWWFVPVTAAFLHGLHPETITSVVPGGWSIAVEMSFYAVLPWVASHVRSLKSGLFFLFASLVLCAINLWLMPQIFFYPEDQQYLLRNFIFLNFLGQLPVFALGILAYLVIQEAYPRRRIAIVGGALFFVFLLAFLYPILGFRTGALTNQFFRMPHHIIAGGLFAISAVLLAAWPVRVLVNRVTTVLGQWSFSMYLIHFMVLKFFSVTRFSEMFSNTGLGSFLDFFCVLLATAPISFLAYRNVEMPGIAAGRRLIERLERDVASSNGVNGMPSSRSQGVE